MRLILLLLALLAPALATAGCDRQKPEAQQGDAAAAEPVVGVDRSRQGKPAPDTAFRDPDGGDISLADFEGVPVLVNLWASWCAPCVKELPTLQRVEQAQARDGQLAVIAISQDIAPKASVDAFLENRKIGRFAAFHDPEMGLSSALGVQIMPTSVLYDSQGREIWRFIGDTDWTGAEASRLLAEAR